MADSTVLTTAKAMLFYDTKDLNPVFEQCESQALILLSKYANQSDMSNYLNTASLTYSLVSAGSLSTTCYLKVNNIRKFRIGDMITIAEITSPVPNLYHGSFIVLAVDETNSTIEIYADFTVTESGIITNNSNESMLLAHAYFILHLVCLHSQSVVKGDVIYSSQQFGNGNLAPAGMSEKKFLADRYLYQALSYISGFRSVVI